MWPNEADLWIDFLSHLLYIYIYKIKSETISYLILYYNFFHDHPIPYVNYFKLLDIWMPHSRCFHIYWHIQIALFTQKWSLSLNRYFEAVACLGNMVPPMWQTTKGVSSPVGEELGGRDRQTDRDCVGLRLSLTPFSAPEVLP